MKLSKGFTLIELIVVMAVFLFVIGTSITIFISIVSHQKRVLAEQQVLSQISYVKEHMSKALRVASIDYSGNCLNGNEGYSYLLTRYDQSLGLFKGIKFINQSEVDSAITNSGCQEFFLDVASPEDSTLVLWEKKGNDPSVPLTSKNLKINFIRFSINGSDGSADSSICHNDPPNKCGASNEDTVQPKVTILLNVKIPSDNQEQERTIQTTVSQRNLNK